MNNTKQTAPMSNQKQVSSLLFIVFISLLLTLTGCASKKTVGPTEIEQAREELPEEELLDVGIAVFTSHPQDSESDDDTSKEVNPEVRKAEGHYISFHLKNALQQSGQWGSVWVTPVADVDIDVMVSGEILESNGQKLTLQIHAADASGTIWLDEIYEAEANEATYSDTALGEKDAFQDMYNTIANDIFSFKKTLSANEIREIRTVSKLRFAKSFSPDAFDNYLIAADKEKLSINRLPADDDPMMSRVLNIREREYMYFDALNGYYEAFYTDMWPEYLNWRKSDLTERVALAKMEKEAFMRKVGGVLLVLLGAALEIDNSNSGSLGPLLILGGGKVFIDGVNISKQTEIHSSAIEELAESFGSNMKPVVIDLEGKQYELSGSAEEQFAKWRELLREIYYTETGFSPAGDSLPVEKENPDTDITLH